MTRARAARKPDAIGLELVDEPTDRAWDDLAVATGAAPFLRPGWLRAASRAFTPQRQLTAFTVRRAGTLVGVLPITRAGHGLRAPITSETAVLDMVAADADAARALAEQALDLACRRVGRLDLRFLPADGPAMTSVLDQARRRGLLSVRHPLRRSPYVNTVGDWNDYERHHLGINQRKSIARRWRRLADAGQATLDIRDGRDDVDALTAEGFHVEARSWKAAAGTAVLSRPSTTAFYRDAARWAAAAGILRLIFVRLDGRAIGFQFALQQGPTLYAVKCGYDDEYARFAPGILVLHATIKHAFAEPGVSTALILGEDEPYKVGFAHGCVEQARLQVFDRTWPGRLRCVAAGAQYRARQVARRRLPESTRARISGLLARRGG